MLTMSQAHTSTGWSGRTVHKARANWAAILASCGQLPCYRCQRPIVPGMRWDVEHCQPLSQGGAIDISNQALSHRRCNRAHGQQLGMRGRTVAADTKRGIRAW